MLWKPMLHSDKLLHAVILRLCRRSPFSITIVVEPWNCSPNLPTNQLNYTKKSLNSTNQPTRPADMRLTFASESEAHAVDVAEDMVR